MTVIDTLRKVEKGEMSCEDAHIILLNLFDVSNCGGIVVPKKLTDKNKILSRAMTYISEDADEGCNIAKQIFIELGSLIEE